MSGARAGGSVEIVLHIPKCAGTTVETHLERHLDTAYWAPPKRFRALPLEVQGRKYRLPPPVPPARIRAVSGHMIGRSVERLFAGREIHRSVLMREPAALVLSWYNYRMMRYRAQGLAGYPLALHLASLPPDPMAHFLLMHWLEMPWLRLAAMRPSEKLARLEDALGDFDRVGDVADCDRMVREMSARLAIPGQAEPENTAEGWRDTTGWRPLRLGDLAPDEAARLARRTALDTALYARLVRRESAPFADADAEPFLGAELGRPVAELRRRRLRARAPLDSPAPPPEGARRP